MLTKQNARLLTVTGLVIVLFLSACDSLQFVTVPVNYDAKTSLRDSSRVLIINQFDVRKLQITNKKNLPVVKAAAYTAIKHAETQLKKLPKIKVINVVDSVNLDITTDSISDLAKKYRVNYVLALTAFTDDIILAGIDNNVPYYSAACDVNFMLYEDNGLFFKKLHGRVSNPQGAGISSTLIGSIVFRPTVHGNQPAVIIAAQDATQDALQEYLPAHIEHKRPVFNDAIFQPAVKELMAKNYGKADTLLTPYLQNRDKFIRSKTAYNLAVVYEAEGDIESALKMADLSNQIFRNDYAIAIATDLEQE